MLTIYPDVKVVIRGPHQILQKKTVITPYFSDQQGRWYMDIFKQEFQDFQDKVWFLDMWDISLVMKNPVIHPPPEIMKQMLKTLISFICAK